MKYQSKGFINVRTIRKIEDGQGLTLKHGRIVIYKTGYQVAHHGVICHSPEEVSKAIRSEEFRNAKNTGIWRQGNDWYVDVCGRVSTKLDAEIWGALCDQLEIYDWAKKVSFPISEAIREMCKK